MSNDVDFRTYCLNPSQSRIEDLNFLRGINGYSFGGVNPSSCFLKTNELTTASRLSVDIYPLPPALAAAGTPIANWSALRPFSIYIVANDVINDWEGYLALKLLYPISPPAL